jgi:hypothetical protein
VVDDFERILLTVSPIADIDFPKAGGKVVEIVMTRSQRGRSALGIFQYSIR